MPRPTKICDCGSRVPLLHDGRPVPHYRYEGNGWCEHAPQPKLLLSPSPEECDIGAMLSQDQIIEEQNNRISEMRKALDAAITILTELERARRQENAINLVKFIKTLDLGTPRAAIVKACTLADGPPPGFRGMWA